MARKSRLKAMGWIIGVLGFDSQWGLGIVFLHLCVQNSCGAHPASYPVGTRGSPPSIAKVKE
jgi:hypothetical protein